MTAVRAREGALERAARAALWVLDIDGVLLDPRPSFYAAARETAAWAAHRALEADPGAAITDEEIAAFKGAGGWNDDFELAAGCAWALVVREARGRPVAETARAAAGGLAVLLREAAGHLDGGLLARTRLHCEPRRVRDRSAARYAGRARCLAMYGVDPSTHQDLPMDGLWPLEPVLCDAARLSGRPLAFFTGRNPAETELAVERLGLRVPVERRVVDDGTLPRKPAPDGLRRLAAHAGAGPMLFVGDSIDDQHAALAYRRTRAGPEIVFVRIASPDAPGAAEADVVAPGLDALVDALEADPVRNDHV